MLASLTVAELDASIAALHSAVSGEVSNSDRTEQLAQLRALHQSLLRATPLSARPPLPSLRAAAEVVSVVPPEVIDALPPRSRTAFRLLRAGVHDAAWEVLIDNASGVVDPAFHASTATGTPSTARRLPLLTRVEPPRVFADLPGFRDPRFDAPDECYDISAAIRLRHHLDEIWIADGAVAFGGWAALEPLVTCAEERVRLVATQHDAEISVDGRRLRRPDLVAADGEGRPRRAWAGWSVRLDVADPRLALGSWALSLELDHDGVSRRTALGGAASDLARAATRVPVDLGSRAARWETDRGQWRLVVTDRE